MTWNYRIIKHSDCYGIHEVHYDENGKPVLWTERPVIVSDSLAGLGNILDVMYAAVHVAKIKRDDGRVLDVAEMPGEETK